jgi:hypothetical protein
VVWRGIAKGSEGCNSEVGGWLEWSGDGISAVLGGAEAERETVRSPKVAYFVGCLVCSQDQYWKKCSCDSMVV